MGTESRDGWICLSLPATFTASPFHSFLAALIMEKLRIHDLNRHTLVSHNAERLSKKRLNATKQNKAKNKQTNTKPKEKRTKQTNKQTNKELQYNSTTGEKREPNVVRKLQKQGNRRTFTEERIAIAQWHL